MSQSPQPKTPTRGVAELLDSLVASDGTGAHAQAEAYAWAHPAGPLPEPPVDTISTPAS